MSEVRLKEVRSSLELTDGCIIDGDRDTVTFAIKLSRSTLRANHSFLLAASEAATDWRPAPAFNHAPVQSVSHWGRRFAKSLPMALCLAATLSVLGAAGAWAYYAVVPAVSYQSIVPDQPTIAQGQPLTLIISAQHNRACQIVYDRAVSREDSGDIVFSERRSARHSAVTDGYDTHTSIVPLPVLPSGDYVLKIVGDYDCGTLDDHTIQVATVHFAIAAE